MPRSARKMSQSDIYHIMIRGINRQDIFLDDEDYRHYLLNLKECKQICGFELYAYCLMTNHIHLVIKVGNEPIEQIFKRIGCRFVYWYNLKHERTGHLFQDRFKSEAVEDDSYFMTVIRYVIQNPMKAGLEEKPGTYIWNSYKAYVCQDDGLTDTAAMRELFGSLEELDAYLCAKNTERGMDISYKNPGVTDARAEEIIRNLTNCDPKQAFEGKSYQQKKLIVNKLIQENVSRRQIERLTGLAVSVVSRMASGSK